MPQFWVTLYRPTDYDGSSEDEAMGQAIDQLNDAMQAAGARFFAGGLQPPATAHALRLEPDGRVFTSPGPYLPTAEHVGGFWILECPDLDAALAWGRQAAVACRAHVEVRPFYSR